MSGLKVFDGTKFNIWKGFMDNLFAYKKVSGVVNGTDEKPGAESTAE